MHLIDQAVCPIGHSHGAEFRSTPALNEVGALGRVVFAPLTFDPIVAGSPCFPILRGLPPRDDRIERKRPANGAESASVLLAWTLRAAELT